MTTLITSLPITDNTGNSTAPQLAVTIALLRAGKVTVVRRVTGCKGVWYGDDGTEYVDDTIELTLEGNRNAIRTALAYFGIHAEQQAVLCAPVKYVGVGIGEDTWRELARKFGGATLLPDGTCYSLEYSALEVDTDYEFVSVN